MRASKGQVKKAGGSWADQSAKMQATGDAQKRSEGAPKRKLEESTQPPISAFFEPVRQPPVAATPAPPPVAATTPAPPPVATTTPAPPSVAATTPSPPPVAAHPVVSVPVRDIPQIVQTRTLASPPSLPWTEKYRPANVVRVIGNAKAKEAVQQWFTARQWRQPLLIAGPNGVGKTSLAHAACRDNRFMVQECNALPGDLLMTVQELVHRKGAEQVAVVLDEVHTYTSHERGELVKLFKRHVALPVILVCDELDKSMDGLKSVCKVVRMYRQSAGTGDMSTLTTTVLKAESKGLTGAQLNMIHAAACGDLRRCTIMLELACKTRRCRAQEQRADLFVDSIFDATTSVLLQRPRALTLDEGVAVFKQHDLMKWMVHENYADACDLETAVTMATYLSDADALDAHASHHLHEHANTLACAAISATRVRTRVGPAPRVTFPAALGTFSRRKSFQVMLHETRLSWHDWRLMAMNFSWLCAATKMSAKDLSKLVNTHSLTYDDSV